MMTDTDHELTDDAFLGGRLNLLQFRKGLRAGIDAVFLAAAVPVSGDGCTRVLDAGTGNGVVGLSILTRADGVHLTGIDIDPDLVALAGRNATRNGLSSRSRFVTGDVRLGGKGASMGEMPANAFEHVVANPPFFESGTVRHAPEPLKDRANVMAAGDLEKWVRFLTGAARPDGILTMVHKADALAELLNLLENRFGDLRVFPLFPHEGRPASRVLVQGRKGSRAPMSLLAGLVLHDEQGGFTPAASAVLREGSGLSLAAAR
ncbi:MAG: tRNA1(Val) (adenine(37)-N6)-methyltransferase [Hyphomicrobiaceae bacterium]